MTYYPSIEHGADVVGLIIVMTTLAISIGFIGWWKLRAYNAYYTNKMELVR